MQEVRGEELRAVATEHEAQTNASPTEAVALSAFAALCVIARYHQIPADPATLAHQLGLQPSQPATTEDLLRAAKHLGILDVDGHMHRQVRAYPVRGVERLYALCVHVGVAVQ